MIGFYDYTIVLTFISLISSIIGITQAINGNFLFAVLCLAISGFCDAFDGKVARTKKNRTDDEQSFGIQLDSLCDVIGFGAFPALMCYLLGVKGFIGGIAICYYCICGVIRLAYYNVLELNRLQMEDPGEKYYHGLPITSMSIIFPVIFCLSVIFAKEAIPIILTVMLFVVGTCFILNFKMKKPKGKVLILIIVAVAALIIAAFIYKYWVVASQSGESIWILIKGAFYDLP